MTGHCGDGGRASVARIPPRPATERIDGITAITVSHGGFADFLHLDATIHRFASDERVVLDRQEIGKDLRHPRQPVLAPAVPAGVMSDTQLRDPGTRGCRQTSTGDDTLTRE